MYAIACGDPTIRELLIVGALFAALESGRSAVLVGAGELSSFLGKAARAGLDLGQFVRQRRLKLLCLSAQTGGLLQKLGARHLIDVLDRAEIAPESLVLFDQADPLFLLGDPPHAAAAMQIYSSWTQVSGHTILGVFDSLLQAPREFVTLMSLAKSWAGFAQISMINQRLLLDVRHWTDNTRSGSKECFELRRTVSGRLAACSLHADCILKGDHEAQVVAEQAVIARRAAFADPTQLQMPAWQWLDEHENVSGYAAAHSVVSVVLQFSEPARFDHLCGEIVALRSLGNSGLRVIVRERGARLRMPMTMTLFRIGVSLIIQDETSDSAARTQIEGLQGSRVRREFDSNIVRVQNELNAILESDPKDTVQFRLAVEKLLAQAEPYQLEHALVRLYSKPGQQSRALELLTEEGRDLLIARDGPVIWVFLFACERAEVRGMLERVFAGSLKELFHDRAVVHEPQRMLAALEAIRLPLRQTGQSCPDYRRPLAEV